MTPILQSSLEEAKQEGIAQGWQKGQQEGWQKGQQEGWQKGQQEGMQAVAVNMLKKSADMAFISEVTGLSIDEINKLKNGS